MMNSEDSIEEDDKEMLVIKQLPWRRELVNKMLMN